MKYDKESNYILVKNHNFIGVLNVSIPRETYTDKFEYDLSSQYQMAIKILQFKNCGTLKFACLSIINSDISEN